MFWPVLASAFSCFFFWHNIILSLPCNDAVALSIENRKDTQMGKIRKQPTTQASANIGYAFEIKETANGRWCCSGS